MLGGWAREKTIFDSISPRAHLIYTSLFKSYLSTVYSKALFIYSLLLKPLRYQRSQCRKMTF